jgi:hypothetical protein
MLDYANFVNGTFVPSRAAARIRVTNPSSAGTRKAGADRIGTKGDCEVRRTGRLRASRYGEPRQSPPGDAKRAAAGARRAEPGHDRRLTAGQRQYTNGTSLRTRRW